MQQPEALLIQVLPFDGPLRVFAKTAIWSDEHPAGCLVAFELPLQPGTRGFSEGPAIRFPVSGRIVPDLLPGMHGGNLVDRRVIHGSAAVAGIGIAASDEDDGRVNLCENLPAILAAALASASAGIIGRAHQHRCKGSVALHLTGPRPPARPAPALPAPALAPRPAPGGPVLMPWLRATVVVTRGSPDTSIACWAPQDCPLTAIFVTASF